MTRRKGFVRPGLEAKVKAKELFTPADYFSVVLFYKVMKEKNEELPEILPKRTDFDDAPLELAEGLDGIIHSMVNEFDKNKIDPRNKEVNIDDLNIFTFIMHDPILKQAIGNVAIQVFMRDDRVDHDTAIELAQEALPVLMGDFQERFLPNLLHRTLPQLYREMDKRSIEQSDALEMLKPRVEFIGYEPVIKHGFKVGQELHIGLDFTEPVYDAYMSDDSPKGDLDSMFG